VKAWLVLLAACSGSATVAPSAPEPLPGTAGQIAPEPSQPAVAVAIAPSAAGKELRRMVPPEAYLRAYLAWFGGLAPKQLQTTLHTQGVFDAWNDYLAALGLPDYKRDLPRQEQTNTLMLATLGRLGEALCARAAEHDFRGKPPAGPHVVFRFDAEPGLDEAAFATRFDQLHRKFLGYPAQLAGDRTSRFFALYRDVVSRHAGETTPLTPEQTAWAAVCTALVQHPEAELY
jgi:hypothetical protein